MALSKPAVIAYDVSIRRSRATILRILKEWRIDGQKSVHECRLTEKEAEEIFIQLAEWIDLATDLLLLAWLEPQRDILCRGIARNRVRKQLWIVG